MPPVSRTCSCGRAWRLWFSRERRWLWGRRSSFFRALPLKRALRRFSPALRLHICTSTQFIPFAAPADLRFFIQQEVLRVWRPIIVHISAFNSGEFAGIAFQDWFWRFALLENALSDMCGRCAESSAHRLSLWRDAWADLRRPKRAFRHGWTTGRGLRVERARGGKDRQTYVPLGNAAFDKLGWLMLGIAWADLWRDVWNSAHSGAIQWNERPTRKRSDHEPRIVYRPHHPQGRRPAR